ncbi:MAG TPA: hypothetical protein VEL07_02755 [Planctomycetota bacterium]|nr:hypothetical protein [Planctomycetota bacterium]
MNRNLVIIVLVVVAVAAFVVYAARSSSNKIQEASRTAPVPSVTETVAPDEQRNWSTAEPAQTTVPVTRENPHPE